MAKLYFYFSAMNAGKSTTLLQSAYNYRERGMKALLFTPKLDDRAGVGKICSRIGLETEANTFDPKIDLYNFVSTELSSGKQLIDCILIDEAQFLSKAQVQQLSDVADKLHIPVLCYGLRTDFLGELFEGSRYLLGLADELIEIKTICHCGRKAIMNMRIDENNQQVTSGDQIEIGGNDRYVATCRRHYKLGIAQPEVKATTEQTT